MSDQKAPESATVLDKAPPLDPGASLPRAPTTEAIDRAFRSAIGKLTGGLSTTAYTAAWTDWALQLALSPGRQLELSLDAMRRAADTAAQIARSPSGAGSPTRRSGATSGRSC